MFTTAYQIKFNKSTNVSVSKTNMNHIAILSAFILSSAFKNIYKTEMNFLRTGKNMNLHSFKGRLN